MSKYIVPRTGYYRVSGQLTVTSPGSSTVIGQYSQPAILGLPQGFTYDPLDGRKYYEGEFLTDDEIFFKELLKLE